MEELYKNCLYELGELRINLEPDNEVWVYLKCFKDDDILNGKYIYNYGVMSPEMKKGIGQIINYGSYTQEIVSMTFNELKRLYVEQLENERRLEEKYPGIILRLEKKVIIKQKYDYGWVDPEGNFYVIRWGEHQKWAYEWIEKHVVDSEVKSRFSPIDNKAGDYLMERGWVLIHNPNPKQITPLILRNETKRLTNKQKDFLFDYYMNIGMKSKAKDIFNT